jgi:putative ABC transport system permease protein
VTVGQRITVGDQALTVTGVTDGAAFNVLPTLYITAGAFSTAVQERAGFPIEVPPSLVGVAVADGADPVAVAAAITEAVEGVEALDRATAVAELPGVGQVTQSFSILYLLLFIVVTIVTGVFFLILTVQKRDSLVLLRAVGAGRADVVGPVLLQVLLVTGAGAVAGALAAAGLLEAAREVFGSRLDPATAVRTVAAIIGLGLLASLGAVRRVLTIDPVEATTPGRL